MHSAVVVFVKVLPLGAYTGRQLQALVDGLTRDHSQASTPFRVVTW